MDPLTAGAIFGSVASGIFGLGSTSSTNRTNLQIARENREFNANMMREQNAWNLEQWNRNNAYNTPLEERKRLEQAGINPYSMLNGTGTAQTQAVSSAPFNGVQMPEMQRPDFSFVGNAAMNLANVQNISAQTKKTLSENQLLESDAAFRNAQNILGISRSLAEINKIKNDSSLSKQQRSYLDLQETLLNTTFNDLVNSAHQDSRMKQASADATYKQAELYQQQALSEVMSRSLMAKNIELSQAKIAECAAVIQRTYAEVGEINARTKHEYIRALGSVLGNYRDSKLMDIILDSAEEENWYLNAQKYNPLYWIGGPLSGAAGAGIVKYAIKP